MAIAQSDYQQPTPPYAVIIFATLAVIFAGISVWLYIKWDAGNKDLQEVQQRQDRLMTAREASQKRYLGAMNEATNTSLVTYLLDQRAQLRTWIVGNPDTGNDELVQQIRDAVKKTQTGLEEVSAESLAELPLVDVIESVTNVNQNLNQAVQGLSENLKNAQASMQAAQNRLEAHRKATDAAAERAGAQALALRNQTEESLRQWQAELQGLSEKLDTLQIALKTEKSDAEETIGQMKSELGDTRDRLQTLIDKVSHWRGESGIEFTGMVTTPDGKIVKMVPGYGRVLIDIGQGQHLPLSLQFEVFSPSERITENTKSKGTIQVVRTGATLSECQIVSTVRDQTIMPGDVIVNAVYDRQNKYVFRVIGEFDVYGTGGPEPESAAVVENLITRWGGEVVSELEVQTDFVVVGETPSVPSRPDGSDQAAVALYEKKLKERSDYEQEQKRASALSVPILNHKRFLYLLGLGERSPLESIVSE